MQEETTSSNGWENLTEQDVSAFCECNYHESGLGRGTAKQCFKSSRLSGAERYSKVETRGLQPRRRAPGKCSMGVKVKDKDMTQNVHISSSGLDHMEIPRSSRDGKHHPKDVIVIEDDSEDGGNENGNDSELNTEDITNGSKNDDNIISSESDARSTKNPRSISCQPTGQRINRNSCQTSNPTNYSEDEDDCQIFMSSRSMKSVHRQRLSRQIPAGRFRYACQNMRSLDSDSEDCEIMDDSYGKIREQWEQAALRRRVSSGMKYKGPHLNEEFSGSGSNFDPNSPLKEFEQEVTNEQADVQENHVDRCSTDPPDLVSASGIVYTSSQDDVTSHVTPKDPETQDPNLEIYNGASLGQSTNTVEVQPTREGNECDPRSCAVKTREVHLESHHAKYHQETIKILKSPSGEAESEFEVVEKSSEWVADREKLKKTAAFKHAEQEEWARRQLELQRQAEEAQRQRKKLKTEAMHKLEMERRLKQRLEEVRENQKKGEETMDLKEQLRGQVTAQLEQVASKSKDLASLLRNLAIPVEGGASPSTQQVYAAYKQALLRFHPDRVSNCDLRCQVEAEETFKLILRLKATLLPVAPT